MEMVVDTNRLRRTRLACELGEPSDSRNGFAVMTAPTRKLSYRKDDLAMRPIYGCPENFREPLSTPTATFPETFDGLLFRSIP